MATMKNKVIWQEGLFALPQASLRVPAEPSSGCTG